MYSFNLFPLVHNPRQKPIFSNMKFYFKIYYKKNCNNETNAIPANNPFAPEVTVYGSVVVDTVGSQSIFCGLSASKENQMANFFWIPSFPKATGELMTFTVFPSTVAVGIQANAEAPVFISFNLSAVVESVA